VQGIANGRIKTFKGIPYGASTGGPNRFLPPKAAIAWTGLRDALGYGPISPQAPLGLGSDYVQMAMWDRHVGLGGMGEDCLNLNVWTPAVNDAVRRPVLVSFHGGGWLFGSGNGPMYDGTNLADLGDVVVVTVNHRLGSFGLTHLDSRDDYALSGVCSVMDMVAALEWVRDNIANFGGNPQCVTVFGQSGGAAKTSVLLATPAAKGLFHRAAIQSGSLLRLQDPEVALRNTRLLLAELELGQASGAELSRVPWTQMLDAQRSAMTKGAGFALGPVLDGAYLPRHPFDPVSPEESADVPVIISTTLEDAATRLSNFDLDREGLRKTIETLIPAKAEEAVALYLEDSGGQAPYLIQAQAHSDNVFRKSAIVQAERRAALGRAPTWMYLWQWPSPAYDGRFGAVHGVDVEASFHNARSPICGSGSRAGRLMSERIAQSWIAFARTGDPNNAAIPHWPAYDLQSRGTMIFDTEMRVENDPRSSFRKLWS
jgi:para-nitrobenzyl esterase